MDENQVTGAIVAAAVEVHRTLGGPGLLESIYEDALSIELRQRGIAFERQVLVPISYKGVPIEHALRLDLVVQGSVIVECKAVALWNPLFEYQLLTYLRVTGRRLGLAINFGERLLKDGIRRVINGYL